MKGIILAVLLASAFLLAGCANNDNDNNNDQDQVQTQPEKAPVKGDGANASYPFTSFDLDVDLNGKDDAIDVDYDQDKKGTEASYVNQTKNQNLQGDAAMKELDEIFSSFAFNERTPDDEVLKSVEQAFDIPKDARSVELEINFAGGPEKKYRR
ncbi:hypothetical protein AC623_10405 [Bacillus sp. FJAT-27231]|uniref:YusW family protein n=1 Tax=Bacillus sp. FJAT-27231 TaxID=1679168 RepID=UPI00067147A6|nr:YusW family protein [Bacillus sp. FJAT-27231]KMY54287.1 hypothetical protein AC623_10405 [Bacillus sp. FJAT-27231]